MMGIYDELAKLEEKSPTGRMKETKPKQRPTEGTKIQNKLEVTQKPTQAREESRDGARDSSREKPRGNSSNLPTRDEIQEFSFRLRDELKVKVQAEVPHLWQKELEEIARKLNVKKLELYRFIIGEFLGKVRRKKAS